MPQSVPKILLQPIDVYYSQVLTLYQAVVCAGMRRLHDVLHIIQFMWSRKPSATWCGGEVGFIGQTEHAERIIFWLFMMSSTFYTTTPTLTSVPFVAINSTHLEQLVIIFQRTLLKGKESAMPVKGKGSAMSVKGKGSAMPDYTTAVKLWNL